jgi:hypothetical protein
MQLMDEALAFETIHIRSLSLTHNKQCKCFVFHDLKISKNDSKPLKIGVYLLLTFKTRSILFQKFLKLRFAFGFRLTFLAVVAGLWWLVGYCKIY